MKGCELCSNQARMYCESDRANLCWDCDEKVHCANFLVANHSRSLLCHVCESPTSWKASGSKLGPTVSVCRSCADNCKQFQNKCPVRDEEGDELEDHDRDDDEDTEYGDSDGDDDDDEDDEEEEEEGENQVVPLASTPTQPPLASCSSSEELSSSSFSAIADRDVSGFKRLREIADLDSEDEVGCSYSRFSNYATTSMATSSRILENDESTSLKSSTTPLLKVRRTNEITICSERPREDRRREVESRTAAAILSSIERYRTSMISGTGDMSATILGICELSRDSRTVDLVSTNPNRTV